MGSKGLGGTKLGPLAMVGGRGFKPLARRIYSPARYQRPPQEFASETMCHIMISQLTMGPKMLAHMMKKLVMKTGQNDLSDFYRQKILSVRIAIDKIRRDAWKGTSNVPDSYRRIDFDKTEPTK